MSALDRFHCNCDTYLQCSFINFYIFPYLGVSSISKDISAKVIVNFFISLYTFLYQVVDNFFEED